jgi:hypothetical protein
MKLTTVPSFTRFYFDSNDDVPVLIEGNGSERRYFVMKVSGVRKQNLDYFRKLREALDGPEMGAFLGYLEQYEPASAGLTWADVRTAPETAERLKMQEKSMTTPMRRLLDMLAEGRVTLATSDGPVEFEADGRGFRVPRAELKVYLTAGDRYARLTDADVERMFAKLHPGLGLRKGKGRAGEGLENVNWWEFPPEAVG